MSKALRVEIKVEIKRDVRIHADLLHTSCSLLQFGKESERRSFHHYQASLVFTAFALEAYLPKLAW